MKNKFKKGQLVQWRYVQNPSRTSQVQKGDLGVITYQEERHNEVHWFRLGIKFWCELKAIKKVSK